MINILEKHTGIEHKKRKYLKSCLEVGKDFGSATDRRNAEDTLEYISMLESAVLNLHSIIINNAIDL